MKLAIKPEMEINYGDKMEIKARRKQNEGIG